MSGVAIVVQARMSSRRLPGKVLAPLAGRPALLRLMQRLAHVAEADWRGVATSDDASDDAVAALCAREGIHCVRGSLEDVLGRFRDAAPPDRDAVVRITGDCPLVDPLLVDWHIRLYRSQAAEFGYVSNVERRTMPDGLDVEVFSRALLERAAAEAREPSDREHVTPWIRRNASKQHVTQTVDLSALRWTLDTAGDLAAIRTIFDELQRGDEPFSSDAVYRFLASRPHAIRIAGKQRLTSAEQSHWRGRIEAHLREGAGT